MVLVCILVWTAVPDAGAFPWGKKKIEKAQTVELIGGVNAAIVEEYTTIELPGREKLAQSADIKEAETVGPESSPELKTTQTDPEPAVTPKLAPEDLPGELPEIEYTIGPGDVLSFQSFDDPTLTRDAIVLYDGTLSLPLIPDLDIDGLTRQQAEEAIKAAYADGVFKEPQVSLTIRSSGSKFYYVLGDVLIASRFPYEQPISVLAAINIAGGLRTSERTAGQGAASPGTLAKAFIIRDNRTERRVIELDLKYLTQQGPHPSETLVMPGDFIYIPEGVNLVYMLGAVRSANVFQLAEGQTLIQTLTRAGGPDESAGKLKNIVLMREVDDSHREILVLNWKEMMRTGNDILMRPGDVVYIPRKGWVILGEFVSRITAPIQQVLSLYSQFYSAYYTDDTYKRLSQDISGNNGALNALQNVRDFGQLFQSFQAGGQLLPTLTP